MVQKWDTLFAKFSNCYDVEDEGMTLDEMVEKAEKDGDILDDISEAEEEDEEIGDRSLDRSDVIVKGSAKKFCDMDPAQRFAQLSISFSPELLNALIYAYKQKENDLNRLNLPYWNININIER